MNDLDKMSAKKIEKRFNPTDHLANERTFLAWIRTNLGIMAFGFVVEKFNLFLQQVTVFFGNSGVLNPNIAQNKLQSSSSIFGISLVGLGTLLCIFAFTKYKKTERQINEGIYQSSNFLNTVLAFFVFFIGIFLIFYLMESHSFLTNKNHPLP